MDITQARFNMIEQQIRPWDVLDSAVLNLMQVVKRERFVSPKHRALAFVDMEIPLDLDGRDKSAAPARMWQPKMEARVLQELALRSTDTVLEVGTGSGYLAALMAHQADLVTSIEIDPALAAYAENVFNEVGVVNVKVERGDGSRGWPKPSAATEDQPLVRYDAIVLTGSVPVVPPIFLRQLKLGGRFFAVVGDAPVMAARLVTCTGENQYKHVDLFETDIAPLTNALQPPRFQF
jgi:protein-L-isoaspartate(D-aspartate) O-methyltransferase